MSDDRGDTTASRSDPASRQGSGGIADASAVAALSLKAASWLAGWVAVFGIASLAMALMVGYLPSPTKWIISMIMGAVALVTLVVWAVKHTATVMQHARSTGGFFGGWVVIWLVMCLVGFRGHHWAWWIGGIALAGLGYGIAASIRRKAQADIAADFRTR